jgi:hypothetical protein
MPSTEAFNMLTEENTNFLSKMMALLENNLGTENTDWFCAAEALINCIFNLKDKRSKEYAKLFLESLTRSMYSSGSSDGDIQLN